MERVAEVSVNKGPLAGRVDLKIENVENTVQAQINSLNNIIRAKPDAILIDAGSGTKRSTRRSRRPATPASSSISFDQVVTEPCAYALESDWNRIPAVLAEWMAKQLGGKGKVFVDRGLAGAPISAQLESGYLEGPEEVPGHRGHRQLQRRICARPGAGRRREPARRPSRGRRHPDPGLRHGRHEGAAGRRPPDRPGHRLLLQRHGGRLRADRRRQVHPRLQSGLARRPRRSSSRSTSSTASRSRPTAMSSSTATSSPPTRSKSELYPEAT